MYDVIKLYLTVMCHSFILSDIDECTEMVDNCHDYAVCTNTIGSFTCVCNDGFSGDGVACAGKNLQLTMLRYIYYSRCFVRLLWVLLKIHLSLKVVVSAQCNKLSSVQCDDYWF